MTHNEYPAELFSTIQSRIQARIQATPENPPQRRIAAFDADGTLWDIDIGETFFDYQIHHCGLSGLPPDPQKHYHDLKIVDTPAAYLWLAQINKGHTLDQVLKWSEQSVAKLNPLPVFQSQRTLIELLRKLSFEIFVVTASIKWAVVPAAARLGIDADHVLGVKTKTSGGTVGLEQDGPMTWREGKATALLEATGGVRPLFCSGNTTGDTALLALASACQLAVRSRNNSGELAATEAALEAIAKERGWLHHTF